MSRIPREFSDLLTARGRRILDGRDRKTAGILGEGRERFVALSGVVDARKAAALRDILDRKLRDALRPMEEAIPSWTLTDMKDSYTESLPKTDRVRTALLESRRARAFQISQELGLIRLLRSPSFKAFAEVLAGRGLRRGWGIQALCYGVGDYTGPHNDHHPEELDARNGYLDVHLSLATPSVAQQFLVYERGGHFSAMTKVNTVGGLTAYRLPFWHYTTPLQARRGQSSRARRWVLLGTFLYARPKTPGHKSRPGPTYDS